MSSFAVISRYERMESNVLSWNQALEKGYEPKLYPYQTDQIPLGKYYTKLDFKIWARKIAGICCYFTQQDTGIKFQLTVCRRKSDELYQLEGCDIDFKVYPTSAFYEIKVGLNNKRNISLIEANISGDL